MIYESRLLRLHILAISPSNCNVNDTKTFHDRFALTHLLCTHWDINCNSISPFRAIFGSLLHVPLSRTIPFFQLFLDLSLVYLSSSYCCHLNEEVWGKRSVSIRNTSLSQRIRSVATLPNCLPV